MMINMTDLFSSKEKLPREDEEILGIYLKNEILQIYFLGEMTTMKKLKKRAIMSDANRHKCENCNYTEPLIQNLLFLQNNKFHSINETTIPLGYCNECIEIIINKYLNKIISYLLSVKLNIISWAYLPRL